MPYIDPKLRGQYDIIIDSLPKIENKGELEYCIFKLINKYMSTREHRYSNLHDAVYATIHAGEEFKRRHLDKREDQAMIENGNV